MPVIIGMRNPCAGWVGKPCKSWTFIMSYKPDIIHDCMVCVRALVSLISFICRIPTPNPLFHDWFVTWRFVIMQCHYEYLVGGRGGGVGGENLFQLLWPAWSNHLNSIKLGTVWKFAFLALSFSRVKTEHIQQTPQVLFTYFLFFHIHGSWKSPDIFLCFEMLK